MLKRAYEAPASDDGYRVLVDRVWPRGITREALQLDAWLKGLAPSTTLRKWFAHDPEKWMQFKHRYFRELDEHLEEIGQLCEWRSKGRITLVFAARDEKHNNAVALREYLERRVDG